MVRLIIMLVAVVVAVVLGVGGLIHFNVIPDVTGGLIKPLEQKEEAAKDAGPPPRIDPVFLDMTPISVPLIQDKQVKRNIFLSLRLDVVPGMEGELMAYLPQLNDLYLRALFQMIPEMMTDRHTPDYRAIKARLLVITERVVGTGKVKDILIMAAFDR